MFVYKITNEVNGKMYIGQTTRSLEKRMSEHINYANSGFVSHLYNAMRKHGVDRFRIELVATASNLDELNQLEDYYIHLWDTIDNGYNMTGGGSFGYTNPMHFGKSKERHDEVMRSEEVRSKISNTLKKYYKDNHDSPKEVEHRRKLSEQKKQLYASPKGEIVKAKQRASFRFTDEHFQALASSKYKPVFCKDRDGNLVASFKCVKDASNWWYNERKYHHYKPPLDDYIKRSFDRDIFIDDIHWYYGEPCAESIES